ncbi:hypothetical protein FHX37_3326 [Haloactinospora alba]|uniref:Uncharacterized protein n=1 Tax=Haloactinospora alba TaxID=405555 RepID=A0A543NNG0_9ACTN|nr:hypothetical protein [Haloactinospora alba]TQN33306.1 hypothetical protein FHX37_3318 [Haloactinospora alba]TQN33312.1 hypothetical protein FHX37_3326 [Haloactinospora alba]
MSGTGKERRGRRMWPYSMAMSLAAIVSMTLPNILFSRPPTVVEVLAIAIIFLGLTFLALRMRARKE